MDQDVARPQTQKVEQKHEYALLSRESRAQQQTRQKQNKQRGGNAHGHQGKQQRDRAVDLVILRLLVGAGYEVPQIAWLDGIEEERTVVAYGRDVVAVTLPGRGRIRAREQLCKSVGGAFAGAGPRARQVHTLQ